MSTLIFGSFSTHSIYSTQIKGKKIQSINSIILDNNECLMRMTTFNNCQEILISDEKKGLIHRFTLNGQHLSSINPNSCLQIPGSICVGLNEENGDEEVYVYDWKAESVFVFNDEFNMIKKIGKNLKTVQYLVKDSESSILYVSHLLEDSVTLWNINDGKFIFKLKIEQPLDLKIAKDKIYIISWTDGDFYSKIKQVFNLNKGNYINVLNKSTLNIIHKIQFEYWLAPRSLHLSRDSNIYTTAQELNEYGLYSKNKYLFIIDSNNYTVKQKIQLNDIERFADVLYMNNEMILCGVNRVLNEIKIIKFN